MTLLRATGLILWKDLAVEIRRKEILTAMLVFVLLVLVTFNFAFDLRVENVREVAPGVLWVAIVFAGTLGVGRSFVVERDSGSLIALLLAPIDREAIYLAKLVGNCLFMFVMEAVALGVFSAFFNLNAFTSGLLLIVGLGTIGFAVVGTLFAAIAAHTRAREVMMPVLLFPILVPVVLGAVKATAALLNDPMSGEHLLWTRLLFAFDVIFLVVSFLIFASVIED